MIGKPSGKNHISESGKDTRGGNKISEFLLPNRVDKTARLFLSFVIFVSVATLIATSYLLIRKTKYRPLLPFVSERLNVKKFTSKEEFVAYLKKGTETLEGITFFGGGARISPREFGEITSPLQMPAVPGAEKAMLERVSETTTQVKGIDEPDIVKTDGREIYFSLETPAIRTMTRELTPEPPEPPVLPEPVIKENTMPPLPEAETKIIKAFPPADLSKTGLIEKTGNLLLYKDTLVLFTNDGEVYGYDVSSPRSPREEWKIELEDNQVVDARLYQGKVYFVTKTEIDTVKPCPFTPLSLGEISFSVKCTDIYHPIVSVPVDVTYTAFILEPMTGKIEKSVSFVGSSGVSVVYMSRNALYVTYTYYEGVINSLYNFFREEGQDLVPTSVVKRLGSLQEYDISAQAKMVEFQNILTQYLDSLNNDERIRVENEFSNRMEKYSQRHIRDLESTEVVKISLDNLKVLATGKIPGHPLNQFSLDEYQNCLRIATTVEGATFAVGESANDVYVLDKNLFQVGSVVGLGLEERIYSVRFIEDKGYLVTFKEIDPFFVLDLSNPKKPQVRGKLKIPGYSSYLHPITKEKILGIGKEEPQVKLSLFDVSSPDDPYEINKYLLDEYWTDVLTTHHAFLLDKEHNVFFLPGGNGGYIFSYKGDRLKLIKAVTNIQARRAIYINNFMYVIGDDKLIVLDESDWEQVNQLKF